MNLDKQSVEERLKLTRIYFIIGLFCLPFVWLINCFWFYDDSFGHRKSSDLSTLNKFKSYFYYSLAGVIVWAVGLISWVGYFQYNMNDPLKNLDGRYDWLYFWLPYGEPVFGYEAAQREML